MTNMKKIQKIAAMLMVGVAAASGTLVLDGGNVSSSVMKSSMQNMDRTPLGKVFDKASASLPTLNASPTFDNIVEAFSSPSAQLGMEKWRATDGAKYFNSGKTISATDTALDTVNLDTVANPTAKVISKIAKNSAASDYSLSSLDSDETLGDILGAFETQTLMQKVQEAAADIGLKPTKASVVDSIDTLFSTVNTNAVNTNTLDEVKDAMTASLMSNEGAAKEMQALANMVQEDVLQANQLSGLSEFLMGLLQLAVDGARKVANVNNFYFQSSLPLLSLPVALDIFDALLPTWPVNFLSYDKSLASIHYVSGLKYTSELGKTVLDIFTTTI